MLTLIINVVFFALGFYIGRYGFDGLRKHLNTLFKAKKDD